jgi:mono/diheme cytochrome c family protein
MNQTDTRIGAVRLGSAGLKAGRYIRVLGLASQAGRYMRVCRGRPLGRPAWLGILALVVVSSLVEAVAGQTSATSVFTKAQVDAGRATYKNSCASCHTADLGGSPEFPQLAGDDFMSAWKARTSRELYEFIHATMPPEGPMLTSEQAVGLVALILYENGATPGTTALTATTAAPIGSVATGKRPGGR